MAAASRHLREIVEIVGVVSIVGSLLLVAWQIQQANRIAAVEIRMQLAQGHNEINGIRAVSPDFAKLFPKLSAPESHLITATENSQMEGLAWHLANVYWSAQIAHDNGLLSREQLENYRDDAAWIVESYPGLHKHLTMIYDAFPAMREMDVFAPIRELAAEQVLETEADR